MTKPLRMFIDDPGAWTLVRNFGDPTEPSKVAKEIEIDTTGDGIVKAPMSGLLVVEPPQRLGQAISKNAGAPWTPDAAATLPEVVKLYLHPNLSNAFRPDLRARSEAISIGPILAFAFWNIEVASLASTLGAKLRDGVLDTPGVNRATLPEADLVAALVRGEYAIPLAAGDPFGRAMPAAAALPRKLRATAIAESGSVQISAVYDRLTDFVEEGQPAVDALLALAPIRWPLLGPPLSVPDRIALTAQRLFPYSALVEFRQSADLTRAQWREVGENQKAIYRKQLLQRVGKPGANNVEPPFEFDDHDHANTFQLEAIVELYANFDDPNAPGATPRHDATPLTGGVATRGADNVISLDGTPDLTAIRPNQDFLYLQQANVGTRPNRLFRITAVNNAAHTVTVHVNPNIPAAGSAWEIRRFRKIDFLDLAGTLAVRVGPRVFELDVPLAHTAVRVGNVAQILDVQAGKPQFFEITALDPELNRVTLSDNPDLSASPTSRWKIILDPFLVVIEPFGGYITGRSATPIAANPRQLQLDGAPDLAQINNGFDTIYLPFDTAHPSRTYVLETADDMNDQVAVSPAHPVPAFGGSTPWHIPSGVSGYNTFPVPKFLLAGAGFDNYAGMMFIVHKGEIIQSYPWTSYTSRNNQGRRLSSIRGNRDYDVKSFRSGDKKFINYAFSVRDVFESGYDGVREARFYFSHPPTDDSAAVGVDGGIDGKGLIRIHHGIGSSDERSTESDGCVVSSFFSSFRTKLIAIQQQKRRHLGQKQDKNIQKLSNRKFGDAVKIWEANGITAAQWNSVIKATLWVIRPEERAL